MRIPHYHSEQGITAVEILVGVSIAALILVFATQAIVQFINTGRTVTEKTQALYLAEEGLELVRFVRDNNWTDISGLTVGTRYYVAVSSTTISVTSTPQVVSGFTRSFTVSNVYRDASDDIVASTTGGAVADTSAKYVTATVTWGSPITSLSLSTIIADLDP